MKGRHVPPPLMPSGPISTYARLVRTVLGWVWDAAREALGRYAAARGEIDGRLADRVAEDVARAVEDVLRRKAVVQTVAEVASRTDKIAARELARQLSVIGIDVTAPGHVQPLLLEQFMDQQLALIRSLARETLERVRKVLDEHRGARVEDVAMRLRDEAGLSSRKAAFIARDQVLRFNARVSRARHEAVGITEYIWSTSRDERVRPSHRRLEGRRFRYADPPVVDETGRRAHPGEDYQCRCVAIPVLDQVRLRVAQ